MQKTLQVVEDRIKILNCMIGNNELEIEPPDEHPRYIELNLRLHSSSILAC